MEDAQCCQQCGHLPGPLAVISGGRFRACNADQLGRHQNPSMSKRSAASQSWAKKVVFDGPPSMVRMRISPRGSTRNMCASDRGSQSHTSHPHGESCHALRLPHLLLCSKDFAEKCLRCVPHALIMRLCVMR